MAREARGLVEDSRTRLVKVVNSGVPVRVDAPEPLSERFAGKLVSLHVRDFCRLWAVLGLITGAFLWYRGADIVYPSLFLVAAVAVLVFGRLAPHLVLPLWRAWMALARGISAVVTPILLTILWCGMVVPIAMVLRILKVKRVNTVFREEVSSYWMERAPESQGFSGLNKQY